MDDSFDLRPAETESYADQKVAVEDQQKGMKYEDVRERMRSHNQFILEMDHLPSQVHRWIDRGAKMTCENAGHPYHEAFKR